MFKIEFFVDDKNLGEAFKRLAGIARNLSHVYVPNVEPRANSKMRLSAEDSSEMLVKEMAKRKLTELQANTAREIVVAMGMSPTSYSHVLNTAVRKGFMTKRHIRPGSVAMIYTLKAAKVEK
jgi:hypothetical protein